MTTARSARPAPFRVGGPLAAAALILFTLGGAGVAAAAPETQPVTTDARGVVHPHGGARPGGGSGDPSLLFHGGAIMTSTVVKAIYWGSSWNGTDTKITGLDRFYNGIGGSSYMKTNTEYTGTNGTVGAGVTYSGHLIDTSAAPRRAPSTSDIEAEVQKMITNPVANGYYPVYTDQPRGHAGYCAWHSYGTASGVPVQFAFFFKLDGDAGCDPNDTVTNHSQGLAALANVSGHELSEAVTDPRNGGWWDKSGAENADKCAWTFNGLVSFGSEQWKIQGNWSNAAYSTHSGYDKSGCIQEAK
jgi:hypothetical protein